MEFLNHLNGIHNKIQFTMEIEEAGHLPFLDIDIYRKMDAPLGTKSIGNPPTQTSTYTKNHITIQPTNTQSSRLWYTELKLCAIRNPCTGINIPHQCLQTKWLQPSADTTSHKTGHAVQQD